ncbi:MAG TPA: AsmA-like C-terminal region-containing protein [Vicinamibacterales bacterium]|nr:AsmA-like C-terminal region-containing protein [Vicinamibacterales bacterium]
MIKKIALGLAIVVVVAGLGLFVWARSVLGTDAVRTALADQLSKALGQPVTVASVSASIYPRVTVRLEGVSIGKASEIAVRALDVGADFRALLSRRIEHATLHLNEARLVLPLPPLTLSGGSAPEGGGPSGAPVELVSVDEVVLQGIELVSRGRTLRGDIDLVPHGTSALTIRRISLVADGAHIEATGEITNLAGPVGTIDLKAGALDLDQLTAFAADFAEGSTTRATGGNGLATSPAATPPSGAAAGTPSADLTVAIAADRATMAGLTLEAVKGRARLHGQTLDVDPMQFGLFGGTYAGTIGATMGDTPTFTWTAAISNLDVAALTAFAGNPGVMTGRLGATVDFTGAGIDAASAMKTARGTARVTVSNGIVKNLALVRSAVAATSLNPQAVVAATQGQPMDEPFSELGATLAMAGGTASTQDLHFISRDIRLDAGGALRLDGRALSLKGAVRLSEELSKQANGTVARLTAEDGRITLPATVTGVAGKYSIQIDTTGMARRAAVNEAKAQAQEAVKKGLGRFLRR